MRKTECLQINILDLFIINGHCRKEPFEDEENRLFMYWIIDHSPDGGRNKGARG
jgi:hypothetical protein